MAAEAQVSQSVVRVVSDAPLEPTTLRDTWMGIEVWYVKNTPTEIPSIEFGLASAFKGGVRRAQGVCP